MSKSNKRSRFNDFYDDEEYTQNRKQRQRDQERRKMKKMKNALRSLDVDTLVDQED